jgi:hypothetical protein
VAGLNYNVRDRIFTKIGSLRWYQNTASLRDEVAASARYGRRLSASG